MPILCGSDDDCKHNSDATLSQNAFYISTSNVFKMISFVQKTLLAEEEV